MMEQRRSILIFGAVFLALVCPSSEVPKNNARRYETGSAIAADEIPESNRHEEDDYYQEFLGFPMASSTDDFGVKGRPGIDFPNLAAIPITSFTCRNVKESGYFADMETKCQVFHICDGGRKMSFLCPNGTIFRQSHLICDWWFRVDCDDSQNFYEPSADTLRRDRNRGKLDRLPSESRESMSITTDFDSPVNPRSNVQGGGRNFYETTQPLYSGNQRSTTIRTIIESGDERNARNNKVRKSNSQNSQYFEQEEQHTPHSRQRDSDRRRTRVNFRSQNDEYIPRAQIKLVNDEDIIRAPKQMESRVKPSPYFEQEEPSKRVSQNYDRGSEDFDSENLKSSTSDVFISANRRIDTVRRKNKNCNHDESEGQDVAETASFAGSHRRGRLESVTFSQISDDIPVFEIPSKEDETDRAVTDTPSKEEEIDSVVTYKPRKEDGTESVITYRPVMDLEKFLHQRREKLTENDDAVDVNGKPYTGDRIPPNIPLSSGPGAVHSLALYIATGGDNLVYNTPRRIEGSLKGVVPIDPFPEQSRTSSSSQKTTPISLKLSTRPPQSPTTTTNHRLVSFSNENESPPRLEDDNDQKIVTTSSPVIITASNKPHFEYTTKSPIFNLEASDTSQKVSETDSSSNSPSTKDIPYVLVKTSLSGRGSKIVSSSNIQYLPTTEVTTVYGTEKTVTEKIPLKNTEPPSLDINLVTTFLPKDTDIPLSDVSYRSLNKNSDFVNIRSPVISSLTKKDYFQEANKTNKATIPSENNGRISIDSAQYSTDQIEYTNTQRPTTTNKAEGTSFFEKEQYFRLDKNPTITKDSGAYFSKQFYSKAEVSHKKSDVSAKKMKDYLLGNFTSEDSGLFQHINKALSETNTTNLTEDTMNILYKNAIEPTLKEAMSVGPVTEQVFPETVPTTEKNLHKLHTESPNTTEDAPESTTESEENQKTEMAHSDTIQITPFFKLENGKITSTSSKFPQDDDLSTTPSDLRELAQVFSRALSAYLEDPETFREALSSVSHPPNPTLPSGVLSDSHENLSNASAPDEDDEVLDFSDVQIPTTTTIAPQKTETTSSKPQSGFYITIPFTSTTTYKTPKQSSDFNNQNNLSHQDAEGPNAESIQPTTTTIPELITSSAVINESRSLLAQPRIENGNDTSNISPPEKEKELNEQEVSKIETTTVKIPETKPATESDLLTYKEPSYTTLPSGKPLTENLPPLEIDLLPPFQDPIPEHEESGADEENNGFTDLNIPTAALDEILNEFVPEELNRLAMTSINPDEIPDNKNNYLSSFAGSLEPNSLSTYDFQNSEQPSAPSSTTTSTTPIPPVTETASQEGRDLLTRLTAKLPQGKPNGVTSQINTVSYNTYANQLLKTVSNSVTEKGESLIRAQSANFLPSQPSFNTLQGHIADKVVEQSTTALDESNSSPTEEFFNEKTTPTSLENLDYEFINTTTKRDPLEFSNVESHTVSTTEAESLPEMKEERSFQGNPRLVLLFVNDHNAKGRGINEKNARLLRALLRKDDHHILHSAGLIPDDSDTREPTTTTTEYNPYTIMSITTKSHTIQKTTTNNPKPSPGKDNAELRTEPPITTYAPKFIMSWLPFKKPRSTSRNETFKAEKLQATEPTTSRIETTTPRIAETSTSPSSLPETQTANLPDTTSILSGEDKSTVSDGRAFDLLRSLYSLTARWG